MASVTFKGNPVNIAGDLPAEGSDAPDFSLVGSDLGDITKAGLAGNKVVLNIFPSVDTPVCAASVRRFNEAAGGKDGVAVICASKDLPFAAGRFCGAEGLDKVQTGSGFRSDFGQAYGVEIAEGPLAGLYARAVVVLDAGGKVLHSQLVGEIAEEPDYDAALAAL